MAYVFVGLFMLLDILTGFIGAMMKGEYASNIMREGLFHKSGEICILVLGALIDYGQSYVGLDYTVPVGIGFISYIVLMEIGSIIENIHKINPELVPEQISKFLKR